MKKMSLIHILMTFYKKDTMLYVGKNWKGSGHLLLIGLCAYCAIFVTYSWSKQAKSTYETFYRPVLALLPPVKYVDKRFKFDAEMPVEIKHPISDKNAIYIDTTTDELPEKAWDYRVVITKDRFLTSDLPDIFSTHEFYYTFMFLFSPSPLEEKFVSVSDELIKAGDEASSNSHFGVYIMTSIWLIILESCKTLLITLIVMFMFNNGGMIRKTKKDFKMVSRLCILTYLPVLLSNSLYYFMMTTPGIFMIIFLSFIHIILLMTAIHLNRMDDTPPNATQ